MFHVKLGMIGKQGKRLIEALMMANLLDSRITWDEQPDGRVVLQVADDSVREAFVSAGLQTRDGPAFLNFGEMIPELAQEEPT